ncbi:MAG: 4-alpha-glucanotransferase, partial [Gammaproteobacteria bacterium]|nr:4-alpha-glucanotransferase [Gammaproteobacteria bacterium]NNL51932.1 4-alpha-glucanotransferase [Woeseiaceae bacterium]
MLQDVTPENAATAPKMLSDKRQAGVCLHIASLPGPYGIGEIGAPARAFVDTMREMDLGVWQFLPVGPTAYGDSPYQPLSTFAGNEMLIGIGDLVDLGLLEETEVQELTALPEDYVDYGALIPIKNRLLEIATQRFPFKADDDLSAAYYDFVAANDALWLHDYALFRILKAEHGERPWPEWQPEYVRRDMPALERLQAANGPAI